MAEETKNVKEEKVDGETTDTKEDTCKCEESEEKGGCSKEKLYGVGMVVAGIVIFAALVMLYAGFVDLLIKGIVLGVAVVAIGLVLLGIVFALYA
ncbi:MAG: hypothetical protein BWK75_00995 [Candidatus Altiarchaeales archaeon A3]|nr:MAG: hypothetical protein BWK75_00995 [Candidatus Altiarchaeales archaeon A3]